MKVRVLCFLIWYSIFLSHSQNLIINEIMSANSSYFSDEDGDYSDWIEIYNNSNDTINLSGYYLSDNVNNLQKWQFPDTIILSNQFMTVFASGKGKSIAGNELHTNFSISSSGENLFLSFNETIIHTVPSIVLMTNESYGLFPDASSFFTIFKTPTPNSSNNNSVPKTSIFFSHQGGYYPQIIDLEISKNQNNGTLYYSIDGSAPDTNSIKYTQSIHLDKNSISQNNINQIQISPNNFYYPESQDKVPKIIVIRAAVFDESGIQISDVSTNSYFIKELGMHIPELPTISLCGDYSDFFDDSNGILVPGVYFDYSEPFWTGNYYQRGIEWEKPVNFEFFENQNNYINQICGLRTHGGNGRRYPQKGLRLYSRSEYGVSKLNHRIFNDKSIKHFKRLVLKPKSTSWSEAGIEDHLTAKLASLLNIDYVSSKPIVLYLNGEYWGVYYLQERIDQHYIENNYAIHRDCVYIVENWYGESSSGINQEFMELYEFIENNNLEVNSNYQWVSEKIDIDNFIDYQLFEIFIANFDWPANNMKCWKSSCDNSKWRWIFYDGDGAIINYEFDGFSHALSTDNNVWSTNSQSTLFLRKLLENKDFQIKFFNRLEYLLNNQYAFHSTSNYFYDILNKIDYELVNQTERFKFPKSVEYQIQQITIINDFLTNRPCVMVDQVKNDFSTKLKTNKCKPKCNEIYDLSASPNPSNGIINVSFQSNKQTFASISISDLSGRSVYFNQITLSSGENVIQFTDEIAHLKGFFVMSFVTPSCNYTTKLILGDF
jgi:hypothetical protein